MSILDSLFIIAHFFWNCKGFLKKISLYEWPL